MLNVRYTVHFYYIYIYINLTNIKTMPRFAFETKANKKVKEIITIEV